MSVRRGFERCENDVGRHFQQPDVPKWRNWQTHQIQGLAPSGVSGFKSRLRHHFFLPERVPNESHLHATTPEGARLNSDSSHPLRSLQPGRMTFPSTVGSSLSRDVNRWSVQIVLAPAIALALVTLLFMTGCVGREIRVAPIPDKAQERPVPVSAHIRVTSFEKLGPGLMPGIAFLDWSRDNLEQTIVSYLEKRRTFTQVSGQAGQGQVQMLLKVVLRMESWDRYFYNIDLAADLTAPDGAVAKSYAAHAREAGPQVRFTAASDEPPIEKALTAALNQLFGAVEADRDLILRQHRPDSSGS